jgi:transcriptional regulator with XRE-family HTH domain
MKAKQDVATRLREARQLAGLSQAQVAAKLGLHRPTITEMEAGRRGVTVEELPALAGLYGVTVGWLVGEADPSGEEDSLLMAARELSKIKEEDLDRLLKVIKIVRNSRE